MSLNTAKSFLLWATVAYMIHTKFDEYHVSRKVMYITFQQAEMLKSFWTCQSFGLILKILSVRTIKYAAEILNLCQSE